MPRKNNSQFSPSVQAKLDEIRTAHAVYQKAMKEHGKTLVKEMASELMTNFPEVTAIRWTQYTPYFADGDPCEFSINQPTVKLTKEFVAEFEGKERKPFYEYGDEFYELATYGEHVPARVKNMDEALNNFYGAIQELEEAMLECFGDHAEITIKSNGRVSSNEYSHD